MSVGKIWVYFNRQTQGLKGLNILLLFRKENTQLVVGFVVFGIDLIDSRNCSAALESSGPGHSGPILSHFLPFG